MGHETLVTNRPNNKDSRLIEINFNKYATCYPTTAAKIITGIFISLIMFSILGLAWAIPFPFLKFLGRYNGFFNWASFFIALCVYGYYKLSAVLSYFIFFTLFAFNYGIMQFDLWQKSGGPALWLVCLIIFIMSLTIQLATFRTENKNYPLTDNVQFILIAPVWLLHFVLKKFKIRY